MEPKFYPYLTEKRASTEHGYKYMKIVAEQDERLKRGEMIIKL